MARTSLIVGTVVAVILGAVLMPAAVEAVNNSTGEQTVTNETVTAQSGEYVDLDGYSIVSNSETVYWYNSTSDSYETVSSGSDYEMNYDPGEIKALSGSSVISDGDKLRVSYDYEASGSTTTFVAGFIPLILALLLFSYVAFRLQDMVR